MAGEATRLAAAKRSKNVSTPSGPQPAGLAPPAHVDADHASRVRRRAHRLDLADGGEPGTEALDVGVALGGVVPPAMDEHEEDGTLVAGAGVSDAGQGARYLRRRPQLAVVVELDERQVVRRRDDDALGPVHAVADAALTKKGQDQDDDQDGAWLGGGHQHRRPRR